MFVIQNKNLNHEKKVEKNRSEKNNSGCTEPG
jgi:hypothetical protein